MPGISRSSRTRSTDASGSSAQRLGAGGGQHHLVAGHGQDVLEQQPVVLVIVDHEDAAGTGGGRRVQSVGGSAQGRGQFHRPVVPGCQGQPVDAVQELARPLDQSHQVRACGRFRVLGQQLGEADDRAERRAQVVAQRATRGRVLALHGVGGRQPADDLAGGDEDAIQVAQVLAKPPRLVVQVLAVGQDGVGGRQQMLAQVRLPGAVLQ